MFTSLSPMRPEKPKHQSLSQTQAGSECHPVCSCVGQGDDLASAHRYRHGATTS